MMYRKQVVMCMYMQVHIYICVQRRCAWRREYLNVFRRKYHVDNVEAKGKQK